MNKHTVVALVQDQPGVLNRIVSLFRRRGYNIESLAVGHTESEGVSRLTLVVEAADVEQVVKQLYRLIDVLKVSDVTNDPTVEREMVLVKLHAPSEKRAEIVALMENASTSKPHLALLADRIAKPFLLAVLMASLGACAYWWSDNSQHALMVAVSVLIVTCPCALSLATPAAMLASAGSLAKSGVLVRRLQALEALSTVDTVVFDKTGTLTEGHPRLLRIEGVAGVDEVAVLQAAAAMQAQSAHPLARAVLDAAREREGAGQELPVERRAHAVTTDFGIDLSAFAAKKAGMSARRTAPLMISSVLTLPSESRRTASLKCFGV